MQSGTVSELHNDDKKSKYSSNPNDILNSAKNFNEKLHTKEANSKTVIAELFSKISNKKKFSYKHFHHCETNIFLDKVAKSINSQINSKHSGNDSVTAKFL